MNGSVSVENAYYNCPIEKRCMRQKGHTQGCFVFDGFGDLSSEYENEKSENTEYSESYAPYNQSLI